MFLAKKDVLRAKRPLRLLTNETTVQPLLIVTHDLVKVVTSRFGKHGKHGKQGHGPFPHYPGLFYAEKSDFSISYGAALAC